MTYVSVIIPTFNKAQLVCDIVRKLNEQTFKDFEVLVIDDGSTDRTVRHLKKMRREERHLKIKVFQTGLTNQFGMCNAINEGLRNASGPLTFLLNDDIYLHSNCIALHVAAQSKTGLRYAFLGPRLRCPPFRVGEFVGDPNVLNELYRKYTESKVCEGYRVYRKKMMVSSNLSINTQTLCDIGGYNEYFTQYTGAIDRDVYHRLTQARVKVLFLPTAQAYSITYGTEIYNQTKWIQDNSTRDGLSVVDWKRKQMRYSERMELRAKEPENRPPPIVRRKS